MQTLEYEDRPLPWWKSRVVLWNLLTLLLLVSAACVASFFLLVFTNPASGFNPFPPPTLPVASSLPTATPTLLGLLPPTWTPTATSAPTATQTPRPTATLPPTATPFSLATFSPLSPSLTPDRSSPQAFAVQSGSPLAIPNIAYPELGCDWMGVGGQAQDMSGGPLTGLVIRLGGALAGRKIPEFTPSLTGVAPQYGRAGYEFKLADKPVASKNSLWVQLVDQAGLPISDKVYFDTYNDCERNLILINFKQVR